MFKRFVNVIEVVALVGAGLFVVMLFVAHPSNTAVAKGGNAGAKYNSSTGALPATGREIFATHCARCHGANGEGGFGPRLAGRVADEFPDVNDQIAVVTKGRGGMPSFGSSLTNAEIRAVVDYTRTNLGG
jgi:mono/diheme cytochrome c family protein